MKTLWFDGESAAAHGLMISGSGTFDAAERDVEMVSIPGRSGDLIVDNGRYKNIPVSYPASISTDFPGRAEGIRAWLGSKIGYCRLEDDYDPDHFRLGRFQGPLRFTPGFLNRTAECTLTFDCKPQRFLKSGERSIPVTNGMVLQNPTGFPALPLIEVTFTPGTYEDTTMISAFVEIEDEDGTTARFILNREGLNESVTVWADPETTELYSYSANGTKQNRPALGGYSNKVFALKPGLNTIRWYALYGTIDAVRIIPRWWTL